MISAPVTFVIELPQSLPQIKIDKSFVQDQIDMTMQPSCVPSSSSVKASAWQVITSSVETTEQRLSAAAMKAICTANPWRAGVRLSEAGQDRHYGSMFHLSKTLQSCTRNISNNPLHKMHIFRIMWQFAQPHACPTSRSRIFMPGAPATASLLAIAISLAGCGDNKETAAAPAPAAATSTRTPAADISAGKVDEAAAKAVAHYARTLFTPCSAMKPPPKLQLSMRSWPNPTTTP